ncbi:hypothetical protein I0C85_23955 [Escherichia coli]|nr:hypothetical protein [Escherichia coli]
MKRIITGCLLLNFAMAAQAECNISSSIQNIDYGKRSAAMRQVDWICPYISRHLLSLNPLLACCRRYSRGER